MVPFDQRADHGDHPRDLHRVGCLGIGFGFQQAKSFGILKKGFLERRSEFPKRNSGSMSPADGLVIDVGEIHHAPDGESACLQVTLKEILEDIRAEVPDMGVRIDCRAAGVEGKC